MAVLTPGIYNSNNFTQDLAVKDFATLITRLMPNGEAPLFALTSELEAETATNIEHGFFAKTMVFPEFELAAAITASGQSFTVASTDNMIQGMLFQSAQTGEVVLINQVVDGTTVSVIRGIGGGATALDPATPDVNAFWYQIGNAYEEASLRPNALAVNPVRITNLTQIFRNTYAISGTAEAVGVIAGDATVQENKRDAAAFHATAIETALFFGKKSQGTRNGQPFRTMDGLINIISNIAYYPSSYSQPNVYTALSTGTSANQLEDMLDPVFNQTTDPKTANQRLLFVGGTAKRVINRIAQLNGEYKLVDGQTNFGLQFKTLQFARGMFRIIEHPLFNTNPTWSKMAVAVDLTTFNVAYLKGRKTQERMFNAAGNSVASDNGIDAVGGTLTTEMTALVKNPPANAVIYNLTAGLANGDEP